MARDRTWEVTEGEPGPERLPVRVGTETAVLALDVADVIQRATVTFTVLVQAWNGELCVGRSTSVPSRLVLRRITRHVARMAVSDVFTLFDRFGTDLRSAIRLLSPALGNDLAQFFGDHIVARWSRLSNSVSAVRGNAGHHFPGHAKGLKYANQQLANVPASDFAELVVALQVLAAVVVARSVEVPGVDETSDDWYPDRSFAAALHGVPAGNPLLGSIAAAAPINGAKPLLYTLKHATLEVPGRILNRALWLFDRRQLHKAIRRRDGTVGPAPEWLPALVDQVEALNAAQAVWLAYTRRLIAIGPLHTVIGDEMWSMTKWPLMMNYYAHATKLFEERPGAFGWLRQNLDVLPGNAASLFHIIARLWIAGASPLAEIRHRLAFHRPLSLKTRREVEESTLGRLEPGVVPAIARSATALCLELGAHWEVDLQVLPQPWYSMPGMFDVRFFDRLDGPLLRRILDGELPTNARTDRHARSLEASSYVSNFLRMIFGSW